MRITPTISGSTNWLVSSLSVLAAILLSMVCRLPSVWADCLLIAGEKLPGVYGKVSHILDWIKEEISDGGCN